MSESSEQRDKGAVPTGKIHLAVFDQEIRAVAACFERGMLTRENTLVWRSRAAYSTWLMLYPSGIPVQEVGRSPSQVAVKIGGVINGRKKSS